MSKPIVIAPVGELDLSRVDEFRSAVREGVERAASHLVIDLSDVAFIDSSGVGVVLEADERLRARNGRLAVVAPRGSAAAVLLTLAGLRRRLTVFDSRAAARR